MAFKARAFVLCLIWITVAVCGCKDRSENETQQPTQGLRMKINTPQQPPQPAQPTATQEGQTAGITSAGPAADRARQEIPTPSAPEKKGVMEPEKSDSLKLAEGFTKKPEFFYDPAGKHDPFESPYEGETERIGMAPTKKIVQQKRLPLTPLQKIDLSQLKLVAIVVAPSGSKALVEDPSGKGYIITQGTYVGQNYGRVTQILKDRVIVEGEVEDFFSGKPKIETTELKLPKKVGDG